MSARLVTLPTILFICTANRCRSPLAEQLMRQALHASGLAALVTSAGLLSGGFPSPVSGIRVAAANGLNLSKHHSVRVSERLVKVSDLILTMSRAHAREIVALAPDSWPRVYPLKQFTELVTHVQLPRRSYFRDAVTMVGEGRKRQSILGNPSYDEVRDPMGEPEFVWRAVLKDLQAQVNQVVQALSPTLSGGQRR